MKKILVVILSILSFFGLVSCDQTSKDPVNPNNPQEVEEYVVTFNVHGGTPQPGSQTVKSGSKLTEPTKPTKEGYEFAGWYVGSNYSKIWNFDDVVTSGMTLHAKWEIPTVKP